MPGCFTRAHEKGGNSHDDYIRISIIWRQIVEPTCAITACFQYPSGHHIWSADPVCHYCADPVPVDDFDFAQNPGSIVHWTGQLYPGTYRARKLCRRVAKTKFD